MDPGRRLFGARDVAVLVGDAGSCPRPSGRRVHCTVSWPGATGEVRVEDVDDDLDPARRVVQVGGKLWHYYPRQGGWAALDARRARWVAGGWSGCAVVCGQPALRAERGRMMLLNPHQTEFEIKGVSGWSTPATAMPGTRDPRGPVRQSIMTRFIVTTFSGVEPGRRCTDRNDERHVLRR
jgi:hypothetical protein